MHEIFPESWNIFYYFFRIFNLDIFLSSNTTEAYRE